MRLKPHSRWRQRQCHLRMLIVLVSAMPLRPCSAMLMLPSLHGLHGLYQAVCLGVLDRGLAQDLHCLRLGQAGGRPSVSKVDGLHALDLVLVDGLLYSGVG